MNIRAVIAFVGATLILSVLGIIALALVGRDIPNVLTLIASSTLTGLIGLLVNPKANNTERVSP